MRQTRTLIVSAVVLLVGAVISGLTLRNSPVLEQFLLGEFLTGLFLSALLLVAGLLLLGRGAGGRNRSGLRGYLGIGASLLIFAIMLSNTIKSGMALLSPIRESEGQVVRAERQTGTRGGGAVLWDVRLQNGEVIRARTFDEPFDYRQSQGRCVLVRHVPYKDFAQILPCEAGRPG